jgi:membrane protease YdiL (CAAX protease family)
MLLEGEFGAGISGSIVFRLLQGGNQLLVFGLAGFIMAALQKPDAPGHFLRLSPVSGFRDWGLAILIILVSIPLVQFLTLDEAGFHLPEAMRGLENWIKEREALSQSIILKLMKQTDAPFFVMNLLIFALLPAFCEELFFRGFLQQTLMRKLSPHLAVWISAFVFSFIHFQFFGFGSRLFLGVALGYFVALSGSLWPGIIAHFVFNLFSVLLSYVAFRSGVVKPEILEDSWQVPPVWIIISALLVSLLFFEYFRRSEPLRVSGKNE